MWQPYLYMSLVIDIDRESNGEWIASVRELQGVIGHAMELYAPRRYWHFASWPISYSARNSHRSPRFR
jgi:hypothetical protein